MRAALKAIGLGLLLLLVLAGVAAWVKREEVGRLLAVNALFKPDRIVWNFTHMSELFHSVELPIGPNEAVQPILEAEPVALPEGSDALIAARRITGVVVLSEGQVTHESYHEGTGPDDLRISWSVSKSYVSALLGIVLDAGEIESLDDPVTRYAPELAGSAYEGASIRDVLLMSSGVAFDEDYFDFWSDINRMGRIMALGGSLDAFTAGLDRRAGAPGEAWRYVSMDTHVLGMVMRGATGQDMATLMAERLLAPMGLEGRPLLLTDARGQGFVLGGLNMMLRDYALFGLMYLQDGRLGEWRIVPYDWVRESTVPQAATAPGKLRYGYHWWVPKTGEGEFLAVGIYGQYIYVNRPAQVVVAVSAADPGFREDAVQDGMIDWFRRIAIANVEAR
ncbi:serine hydrolase domain-containing protein [Vannielia litorea]|uniref:CubicO group peptidase, beta-lactamase class C family n=1 Tax=Vannielia litorea TaxID=1217970 RepID=A0A1N6IIA3_9RHOB|nr:serine hydrolase [Vannielia litorea]SIO31754.1 CubicO group peptidase, beta-lactamase class C family [Vannielia litorea]